MGDVDKEDLLKQLRDNYDNHGVFLQDLGKKALEAALFAYFTAAHPDDDPLVVELVKVNLSRYHLKNAFEELYKKHLIKIFKVRNEGGIVIDKYGTGYSLHNFAMIFGICDLGGFTEEVLAQSLEGLEEKVDLKNVQPTEWKLLERIGGLKCSMYNLALQVAGLMHVADASTFWEKYKPYMKLVSSGGLVDGKTEAEKFEDDMCFYVEAVPCFSGCLTSTTIEETRVQIEDH